jgi:hypothetical protein
MDPKEIFSSDKLLQFWPNDRQTATERAQATTRFIIYATCIVYLIQRDVRVFALGGLVIGVLFYMYKNQMIQGYDSVRPAYSDARPAGMPGGRVQMPSADNPMGNALLTDIKDNPDRPPAAWYPSVKNKIENLWAKIHPFDTERGKDRGKLWQYDASSRFYTAPNNGLVANDQTAFAQASFGVPFSPMCKDDSGPWTCGPDEGFMGRTHFPEQVQMRGGNGRSK